MAESRKKISSQLLLRYKDLTVQQDLTQGNNFPKQPQKITSPLSKLRRSTPQLSPIMEKMLPISLSNASSPFERRCFESPKIVKADFSIDLTDYFSNSQCTPFRFQTQEENQEQDYVVLSKRKRRIAANLLLDKPHSNVSFILNGCQQPFEAKRQRMFIMKLPLIV